MTRPRAVLFDAGNTLVFLDQVRLLDLFSEEGVRTDPERVRTAELVARRGLLESFEEGSSGTEPEVWHDYFVTLFQQSGVGPEVMPEVSERVRRAHAEDHMWTQVTEGTSEALSRLSDEGFRLGVISNADGRMESVLERCGLRPHFEFVIDSEVVGVEKPDPAIFHAGCEAMGELPGTCVYVGDLYPVDYVGATRAGLRAILFDPLSVHGGEEPTIGDLGQLHEALSEFPPRR